MKDLIKEIMLVFFIIIFSNALVDFGLGEKELQIMNNPIKTIGITLIVSIVIGCMINWIKNNSRITKKN